MKIKVADFYVLFKISLFQTICVCLRKSKMLLLPHGGHILDSKISNIKIEKIISLFPDRKEILSKSFIKKLSSTKHLVTDFFHNSLLVNVSEANPDFQKF